MVKPNRQERRLERADWLAAGLRMVAQTGVEGLKVQQLAASLGATTGSLYWHFRDRSALVHALVDHWVEASTETLVQSVSEAKGSPEERLLLLMTLVQENAPTRSDLSIRAWAGIDTHAARAVRRVDERRAQVVRGLYREMGLDKEEADMRTHLILCYESCERHVFPRLTKAERRNLLERRHRLFCVPTRSS
jgi:AcrR family transcriptional regulator